MFGEEVEQLSYSGTMKPKSLDDSSEDETQQGAGEKMAPAARSHQTLFDFFVVPQETTNVTGKFVLPHLHQDVLKK